MIVKIWRNFRPYFEVTQHISPISYGDTTVMLAFSHLLPNWLITICQIPFDLQRGMQQYHIILLTLTFEPPSLSAMSEGNCVNVAHSGPCSWSFAHFFPLLLVVVGALKSNKALQELHLTNNLLNSYQDTLQLGDLLRYNTTLLTLDLSNNSVADAGKMAVFVTEQKIYIHSQMLSAKLICRKSSLNLWI